MTDEQVTRDHRDGSLSVCAAPVTDAPGWLITTRSRRLADAAAATTLPGGTVHARENGEWQARLPEPVLAVMVLDADAGTLRCRLSALPCLGVFALAFAPWPAMRLPPKPRGQPGVQYGTGAAWAWAVRPPRQSAANTSARPNLLAKMDIRATAKCPETIPPRHLERQ